MLDNLKSVLIQNKKFLAIFFVVIFLPSIILAFFGIRAIHNERYKLLQQNLEQQRQYVSLVQAGIQSIIERESLSLKELSSSKAFLNRDHQAVRNLITQRLQDKSFLGQLVIWDSEDLSWLPGWQFRLPGVNILVVPEEWKRWHSDLEKAERAEFRRRNLVDAVSLYDQILNRAEDKQVKAWLLSRIARCEVKQKKYKQALKVYRSILSDFPGLLTESGRPLDLTTRLEILDAFLLDENHESFFRESLDTYSMLEQKAWFLDGDQIKMYTDMLKNMVDEVVSAKSSDSIPEGYIAAVDGKQVVIEDKLETWRMAEAVRCNILPGAKENLENLGSGSSQVYKNAFEYENNDILVLMVPLDREGSVRFSEFLGSLLQLSDLTESIDTLVKKKRPPGISLGEQGVSILLHSTLSGNIVFGDANAAQGNPLITDFFPENFPPWRMELYQVGGGKSGLFLYKNIFFWTIITLLIILFIGSGLIIRTIIHEVNLVNLKSEFIASVSHEFKTPLTAMGAVLERLLSDEVKDPQKTKEYYRILSHDSDKLKRLVKNVLDFTKIEDGKREYRMTSMDITRLVRQDVDSFQEENRMASFRLEIETDDDIPSVLADEEAIGQALHNILDNAAKFSSPDKEIEVKVIRRKENVEIAVQDRGVGIPENELKKVFEKFYRGKQASSVSPTGTGLGLTLVKHIMDAHGGDVIIRSQPGKGTCVSLILPLGNGV